MSRRRVIRNMHEYGSGLHGMHILVEPEVPAPDMFFTNGCTGERHVVGTAEPAPLQRMEAFQHDHALAQVQSFLNTQGGGPTWADMTPEQILRDIQNFSQRARDGRLQHQAGPWDYLDYGLTP